MHTAIVGYTGFVGTNLCLSHHFDAKYNRSNITDAYGTKPDLLVYSGVPAEMFLANKFPERDLEVIEGAIDNIKRIQARKVVLISTIAVYPNPTDVDETSPIDETRATTYGRHRRMLERWVEDNCGDYTIIRLPALYGHGLKKNFIYDLIHVAPSMLNAQKYTELSRASGLIAKAYALQPNGFYRLSVAEDYELEALKAELRRVGFTALSFTDSRSQYQYFNLSMLWPLIEKAVNAGLTTVNVATAPVTAARVYEWICGSAFENHLESPPLVYDFKTIHCSVLGGSNGYLISADAELEDLKAYVISTLS